MGATQAQVKSRRQRLCMLMCTVSSSTSGLALNSPFVHLSSRAPTRSSTALHNTTFCQLVEAAGMGHIHHPARINRQGQTAIKCPDFPCLLPGSRLPRADTYMCTDRYSSPHVFFRFERFLRLFEKRIFSLPQRLFEKWGGEKSQDEMTGDACLDPYY